MNSPKKQVPGWQSRLGFIMATSGAAIGLGNIQRFPSLVGQNGGGAFVLLYLGCVLALALPLMLVELALGRGSKEPPVLAFGAVSRTGTAWNLVGWLGTITSFAILTYYMVASGWTTGFALHALTGSQMPFKEFASEPGQVLAYTLIFQLITTFIVARGLNKGIETFSKYLMPALFILLILLIIRALTLPGSWAGVVYYLTPDFSLITRATFVDALAQAFFSLCIGEAVLITYGSYAAPRENLVSSALLIAFFDTAVAFLAGLMIFPAIFAFNESPDQGLTLIFQIMPKIFVAAPLGRWLGVAFYVMLGFAALTTCIALLEIPSQALSRYFGWDKRRTVWSVSFVAFLFSIPSAWSQGGSAWFTDLTLGLPRVHGFYEIMDFIWGGVAMVISGLLTTLFVAWVWGTRQAAAELKNGCPGFRRWEAVWGFHIRWIAPLLILMILGSLVF